MCYAGAETGWIETAGLDGDAAQLSWSRLLLLARQRGGYSSSVRLTTRHSQLSRKESNPPGEAEEQDALSALLALHRTLHAMPKISAKLSRGCWLSSELTQKMQSQIDDTLSMATNALPEWFARLPQTLPFIFPLQIRQLQFRSMVSVALI